MEVPGPEVCRMCQAACDLGWKIWVAQLSQAQAELTGNICVSEKEQGTRQPTARNTW